MHETTLHINCKELLASWLGLQCYASITAIGCIHTSLDRQHSSAVANVNSMGGLHSFQEPVSTSITGLGLVSLQEPYNFSRAPFGLTEPIGRQGIENRLRFFRMGIGHPDLPQTDGDEGPVYCGSLCIPFFRQISNILQLENGSRSESSAALIQSWHNIRGYAFLHFCLTSRYSLAKIRAEKVPWVLLIVDHTFIEITNLVSSIFKDDS